MKIYITIRGQEAVLIDMCPKSKVLNLKNKIVSLKPNLKTTDQILTFKSRVLCDSSTLIQAGIRKNSIIELITLRGNNFVFIKMANSCTVYELEVSDFQTNIGDLKEQIYQLLAIPVGYQQLYKHTIELKDNDTLKDKMIGPETILNLHVANFELSIHLWEDSNCQKILIPCNSKVSQLKEMITSCFEIPVEFQTLYYDNHVLDVDDKTLIEYQIRDRATIEIDKNDITIFIGTTFSTPNEICLRLFPSDTVKQIKELIKHRIKCNPDDQKLFWNNSILNDSDILRDAGITTDAVLFLIVTSHILCLSIQQVEKKSSAKQWIRVVCQTTESFGQLKKKLARSTQIPVQNQILYLNAHRLYDEQSDMLLMEFGINETSNITLVEEDALEILVKTCVGQPFRVAGHQIDTIEDLKNKIKFAEGIPIDQLVLIYEGHRLENPKSIADYEIKAGATLHLLHSLPGRY